MEAGHMAPWWRQKNNGTTSSPLRVYSLYNLHGAIQSYVCPHQSHNAPLAAFCDFVGMLRDTLLGVIVAVVTAVL